MYDIEHKVDFYSYMHVYKYALTRRNGTWAIYILYMILGKNTSPSKRALKRIDKQLEYNYVCVQLSPVN